MLQCVLLFVFLRTVIEERYNKRNYEIFIRTKKIGVDIRSSDPNSLDRERAVHIGYGTVQALLRGDNGVFITLQNDNLASVTISSLIDIRTGIPFVRKVNLKSLKYEVASKYMIRLNRGDLIDSAECYKLASFCQMTPTELQQRFDYLTRSFT